jgi:hypothetical protein
MALNGPIRRGDEKKIDPDRSSFNQPCIQALNPDRIDEQLFGSETAENVVLFQEGSGLIQRSHAIILT